MKKIFCDICEEPAEEGRFDKLHVTAHAEAATPNTNCHVAVHPVFTFINHPAGFGGPPDLCGDCRQGLLEKLKLAAEGKINP